jgi:hypothetical protein
LKEINKGKKARTKETKSEKRKKGREKKGVGRKEGKKDRQIDGGRKTKTRMKTEMRI